MARLLSNGFESTSFAELQTDGRCDATERFSRTVRSSKSSTDCHVRASPLLARACGARPERSWPSSSTRPRHRTKPLIASMNVVFPAPFGPIRPTSCPSRTSRSASTSARTPPKLTDTPLAWRTGVTSFS
jgi:hypothetical protein